MRLRFPLLKRLVLVGALGAPLVGPLTGAHAQPPGMPDPRMMRGKPLPLPTMAAGSVAVRVSRQTITNVVAGIDVSAVVAGEDKPRTAKTDAQGRATFDGLPVGATFTATATLDGETQSSETFPIPSQGGIRVALIFGLGAAPAKAPEQTGDSTFGIDSMVGTVKVQNDLPAGTLDIALAGTDGAPLAGREVMLGEIGGGAAHAQGDVKVHRATTDARGVARFKKLATGSSSAYAAVALIDGRRLATQPFRMDEAKGMRGDIHALGTTSDKSVLRLDESSRFIFLVREDGLEVMQSLVVKNVSPDKVFNGGEAGVMIPLPKGHVSAQALGAGAPVEVRPPDGVAVRAAISPGQGAEARFGFVLPANGDATVDYTQVLPLGAEKPLVIVPDSMKLTVSAPGLTSLPDDKDAQGNPVHIYRMPDIPAGGTFALTIAGIPQPDKSGQHVAAVLSLLLVAGAVVFSRKPASVKAEEKTKDALLAKREALFRDLVSVEEARRAQTPPPNDGEIVSKRRDLVAKLETVYRELAEIEARRDV